MALKKMSINLLKYDLILQGQTKHWGQGVSKVKAILEALIIYIILGFMILRFLYHKGKILYLIYVC